MFAFTHQGIYGLCEDSEIVSEVILVTYACIYFSWAVQINHSEVVEYVWVNYLVF
jgi:hypothetical protein